MQRSAFRHFVQGCGEMQCLKKRRGAATLYGGSQPLKVQPRPFVRVGRSPIHRPVEELAGAKRRRDRCERAASGERCDHVLRDRTRCLLGEFGCDARLGKTRERIACRSDVPGLANGHGIGGLEDDVRTLEEHVLGGEEAIVASDDQPLAESERGGHT